MVCLVFTFSFSLQYLVEEFVYIFTARLSRIKSLVLWLTLFSNLLPLARRSIGYLVLCLYFAVADFGIKSGEQDPNAGKVIISYCLCTFLPAAYSISFILFRTTLFIHLPLLL